ncbi:hypothetical protein CONCODRAFT_3001 [Conidiobolus coronatus NRRL 28638]|uniref:RING-type domain-containing protein n=1 Tax=Conidiobolus coronatus (strain ATCC 28846 / CBS 209.66 / NRRL 28638) TaxID=796925 RepID=A0A137PG03_CONC2|nr:hypothetical protein CONCODRAFT_3001 [Conidiobolus coronatus NRRL 28638]|eukprot:KXN73933.1 hypothetical protein CONCODRAFT_3001 [Conidiobolus coronatus NRRL 28638]
MQNLFFPSLRLDLSDNEEQNIKQNEEEYQKEHAGHDSMHSAMFFILVFIVVASQLFLVSWKKKYYSSYQLFSVISLWFIPPFYSYLLNYYPFVSIWACYSVLNIWIMLKASSKPLHKDTPKVVYRWFSVTYRISYFVGLIGYLMFMFLLFGVAQIFYNEERSMKVCAFFLGYGLYFGALSRDFAEICSDKMASTFGLHAKGDLPQKATRPNLCAICNGFLRIGSEIPQPTHTLECDHQFHESCLRGWCLIGKKDICPYCHEKVSLKELSKNPWDIQERFYINVLDWLRYFAIWLPLAIVLVQFIYMTFDLK